MVDKYYRREPINNLAATKRFMQSLFDVQDRLYGSNDNSDAERTAYLINNHSSFTGVVRWNPTITQIKQELNAGRPAISLHRGFDLHNPNIPFLPTGSSYHTLVLIGFDEETRQFITNDPGDEVAGNQRRYDYQVLMNSLHDYNYATNKADGPPKVIFTSR